MVESTCTRTGLLLRKKACPGKVSRLTDWLYMTLTMLTGLLNSKWNKQTWKDFFYAWVAKIVDPDQVPYFVASDLSLHCLLRKHVSPKS